MVKAESSQNQTKGNLASGAAAEAHLPNRRSFFARLALDAITGVGTLNLGARVVQGLERHSETPEPSEDEIVGGYPYTNTDTEVAPGVFFRNLGVSHCSWSFMRDRSVILEELHRADVVLLEGFAGQDYFDYLAALAHQSGKGVVRLEGDLSHLPGVALSVSPLANPAITYLNGAHFFDRAGAALGGKEEALRATDPSVRRAVATSMACFVSEIFRIIPVPHDFRKYPADDWSHTVDGRTVIMLHEISKIAELNRNLSVLAITGDAHARGFRFYTSSPENRELFREKLAVFNKVYKSWLGGNATLEVDPAKAPNT